MIPAKTRCPSTWTLEYSGYLMSVTGNSWQWRWKEQTWLQPCSLASTPSFCHLQYEKWGKTWTDLSHDACHCWCHLS